MVYQDFSPQTQKANTPYRIAPLSDRILAFVFDLIIFMPVFSFVLANLFRKLELVYFTSPDSIEFLVLAAVSFVFVAFLTILFQTLFLLLMRATPGKYFFKLQVISLQEPTKQLRFSQAFLRSTIWVLEFICLLFPFLEIASESLRRPVHDRAAGTMVVTLKNKGDSGPHLLESQFVRQILVVVSLCGFVWATFFVGHFYKMAVRGDFKKSELESDNSLCSTVTSNLKGNELRIDKALALYLADSITEECLSSEADFVLWTPSSSEKSWAYLAKGLLKKYDTDQMANYLEKSCEMEEGGEACQIAQFEADPATYSIPEGSQTSAVLRVTQDFEKGRYAKAEKEFLELAHESGFEAFSQQGLVKTFWAQNKVERAQGAYQSVVHQMDRSQSMELSAWMCHEELDRKCTQEAYESCETLKSQVAQTKSAHSGLFVALALIREKECRHTSALDERQYLSMLEDHKDVLQYVKAISKDSNLSNEDRSLALQDLALRKDSVRPVFLRRLALQQWIGYAHSESDLNRISQFLKEKKVHDLSWIKVYERAMSLLIRMKADKQIREIVNLPSEEIVETFHLETAQIQGQYLVQNYEKAWDQLQRNHSNRAPASMDPSGNLSLEQIRHDLESKHNLHRATQ
jgi:uncharacterized RDD family membrane protein YckC